MDQRVVRAQQLLHEEGWDAIVVDSPVDLLYLLGIQLSAGGLLIGKNSVDLFVDGRYFQACKEALRYPVHLAKATDKPSAFSSYLAKIQGKIAFDSTHTSYDAYTKLEKEKSKDAELIPAKSPIEKLREIKERSEIDAIETACKLACEGVDYLLGKIHEGISEKELASELEIYWKKHGGDGEAFETIIAFGENSAKPHHRAGLRRLEKGDVILIDCGVMKNHYASDITRVFFFGEPPEEIRKIYHIVHEAYEAAFAECRPGVFTSTIDAYARQFIQKAGYGEAFSHGLGHGLGLDVHELPRLRQKDGHEVLLQEGMVFTIEPGIYIPGLGGVRLENTVVLERDHCRVLTNAFLPKEILNVYKHSLR